MKKEKKKKWDWPKGGMTAEDAMAKLNADPEWVANKARRDREFEEREAESRRIEAPLIEELRAAGFEVESAWDFVNSDNTYAEALPILLDHLQRPYPGPIREGIARALGVPETKALGWDILIRLFQEEEDRRAKDGLAVAIAATADDEVIGDVISLVRDAQNGHSRGLLLSAIENSADPRARAALMDLETDPQLKVAIEYILRGLKKKKRR